MSQAAARINRSIFWESEKTDALMGQFQKPASTAENDLSCRESEGTCRRVNSQNLGNVAGAGLPRLAILPPVAAGSVG